MKGRPDEPRGKSNQRDGRGRPCATHMNNGPVGVFRFSGGRRLSCAHEDGRLKRLYIGAHDFRVGAGLDLATRNRILPRALAGQVHFQPPHLVGEVDCDGDDAAPFVQPAVDDALARLVERVDAEAVGAGKENSRGLSDAGCSAGDDGGPAFEKRPCLLMGRRPRSASLALEE